MSPAKSVRSRASLGSRSRGSGKVTWVLHLIILGVVFNFVSVVTAQVVFETVTATATGSASLNAPSRMTQSGDAATTASSPQVTSTVIPNLQLSGTQVPFLLQKPIPSQFDELRYKVASPSKDIYFTSCPENEVNYIDAGHRINISAVYVQFDSDVFHTAVLAPENSYTSGALRIVAIGATDLQGMTANASLATPLLSTLSVETEFLTFSVFSNYSYLCDSLFPTTIDPNNTLINQPGCLYGPGQVSVGFGIPLNDTYTLGTLWTRVRLSDTSSPPLDIACFEVYASPYADDKWYWDLLFWFPVALAIGYFVVIALARVLAAVSFRQKAFKNKAREGSQPNIIKDTIAPTIVASLSGRHLAHSAALLRFATPGCWDIIMHIQFVAAISMVAVRWPEFSYPFFKQAAWSTLVGNTTIVRPSDLDSFYNLLRPNAVLPEGDIGNQFSNTASPLYMNEQAPNRLMNLNGAKVGMDSFAQVVGLRNKDLFGTCLSIWFLILAVILAVSFVVWLIDSIHDTVRRLQKRREDNFNTSHDDRDPATGKKEIVDNIEDQARPSLSRRDGYHFLGSKRGRLIGSSNNTFHLHMLHGNIARAVVLFHFPITIFTTYQMANASIFSATSVGLAGLAFSFFSILIPTYLVFRISRTPTAKLYDSISTLTALGPLYNTYSPGSQLFCVVDFTRSFVLGVAIGAGQASGSTQAIIILVFEILFALACSLWLPWGEGAMMGPTSFVANVLRIITSILVLLLSPLVNFGRQPIGWITYVILLIQGILCVCAALILLAKIIEGLVRLFWHVSFDERASPRTSGLGGAYRKIKRRKDTLQLGKGGKKLSTKQQLNRSPSTTTQTLMLAKAGKAGSTGSHSPAAHGSPQQMTSSLSSMPTRMPPHSRQASYASYLDNPFYGRKSPAELLADGSSPYSTYLRGDPHDEGFIMAALPPSVTTARPVSPLSHPQWNGRQSPSPLASTGFVRTGGGRTTDTAPYQTLSTPRNGNGDDDVSFTTPFPSMASKRPRPLSQSAVVESYDQKRRSMPPSIEDPNAFASTETAARQSSRYSYGAQLRPTQSAADMMAVDEEGQTGQRLKTNKVRNTFWPKKSGNDETDTDEDDEDDEDDDDGLVPFKSKGGWRGLHKMSEVMSTLAARLGRRAGVAQDEPDNSIEVARSESEGATISKSKGFEVVRPQRPRKISATAEKIMDSTGQAAQSATSSESAVQATRNRPLSQDARTGDSSGSATQYLMSGYKDMEQVKSRYEPTTQDFDPSSGTLPPGAAYQALLLPQHRSSFNAYPYQSSQGNAVISAPSEQQTNEDMFWVSSSRPHSLQASGTASPSGQGPDSQTAGPSSSSKPKIIEPMQAEVLDVDDTEGNPASVSLTSKALLVPSDDGPKLPMPESLFDAQGNLDPSTINLDRSQDVHLDAPNLLPSPQVWDAAQAYNT